MLVLRSPAGADVASPARKISSVACRPLSGSSTTRWLSTTWPMPVECVSTIVVLAVTVTCSLTTPTASVDVDLRIRADLQDDAVLHVGVEPLQRDLQLIRTDGRFGRTKVPSPDVTTVRTAPVSIFVTVTSAPGNAPPLESRTTPET